MMADHSDHNSERRSGSHWVLNLVGTKAIVTAIHSVEHLEQHSAFHLAKRLDSTLETLTGPMMVHWMVPSMDCGSTKVDHSDPDSERWLEINWVENLGQQTVFVTEHH